MAKNTQEVLPRICKCESPEKDFSYPACKTCWKCKVCGVYGGCDGDFQGFITRIFVNNKLQDNDNCVGLLNLDLEHK